MNTNSKVVRYATMEVSSDHISRPGLFLKQLREQGDTSSSDMCLVLADGSDERLHSIVAYAHSEKLAKFFSGRQRPCRIDMTSFRPECVRKVVDWMYDGELKPLMSDLTDYLIISHHLGLEELHSQLEQTVRLMAKDDDDFLLALETATKRETGISEDTVQLCVQAVRDRFEKTTTLRRSATEIEHTTELPNRTTSSSPTDIRELPAEFNNSVPEVTSDNPINRVLRELEKKMGELLKKIDDLEEKICAVVAEIAPWKITHTAVVDAAPAMPPGAPEKKEQKEEKQTKEKEAARKEEKKAAEAEAHAVQGNETRGDPDEEQPIQAARERRADVTRMVDAAKETEVGLKQREIAACSSKTDGDLVKIQYGVHARWTCLEIPQFSQLRGLDGVYLLRSCSEVVNNYALRGLMKQILVSLNVGGFCILNEEMDQYDGLHTKEDMTMTFRGIRHMVVDGICSFDVHEPEALQAPGEVFWVLVKRKIPDGPAEMKRAIPTDAAQGNGHDTHHRGCTTVNYHISGGSHNIVVDAAPAMPPGAPEKKEQKEEKQTKEKEAARTEEKKAAEAEAHAVQGNETRGDPDEHPMQPDRERRADVVRNDCSAMPSVMPAGAAAKPAAKTRSIPSVGNPEKTANQEKADKDKADKPAGAAPGATPKAAEAPKEGVKEGPKKAAAQQQPQVATVAANGGKVVQQWVQRALDMGVDQLRNEYKGLAKYTLPDMTVDAFKANHEAGRNRYQDVPCQDQCRVVNKWPGAPTDYVHANYVGTPLSAKRFVCTQGPLDTTVNDFWMMVVQEEAETIVMLCNCVETGKLKCAQYWPQNPGEVRKYDAINFEITNKEMRVMSPEEPTVIVSILSVKFIKPGGSAEKPQTREVRHYQWQDWPDRGVPPCKLTAMELLSRVRGTQKPIIVHCSAGIGRTGTIVAIEYILEHIQAGVECATMCDLLKELRNQRAYTIHNDLQYLHIHRVMLCYFLEKHKARYEMCLAGDNAAKYEKFVKEYDIATTPK